MTEIEKRGGKPAEIRAESDGVKVAGYAAVFNDPADIGGMFIETILPGAFTKAIGRDDVSFLINHDGLPLARTSSGTLKLSEDDRGLKIESTLDGSDPDVQRIVPKMTRGDLTKMSFAFIATKEEWDWEAEPPRRSVSECELYDVSIVTDPAYDGTSIKLRFNEVRSKALADATAAKEAEAARRRENFAAAAKRISERKARSEMKLRAIG